MSGECASSLLDDGELPEGWATAAVGDIYASWGGATPGTANADYWGGPIPWISSKDVKQWRLQAGSDFISKKALVETRLRLCPAHSVLVVVRSGVLAHTLPVAVTDTELTINQDIKAFCCGSRELNEWLAYALRTEAHTILAESRKDGTTVQSVQYPLLQRFHIRIPPLAEQRRIVEAMDSLFGRVNAAKERLAKVPQIMKRFRQAVLAAACSGRLTADWRESHPDVEPADKLLERIQAERKAALGKKYREPEPADTDELPNLPKGWPWTVFPSMAEAGPHALKAGPFGSALKKQFYSASGFKVYGQEQVIRGDASYGDYYIDETHYEALKTCAVKSGDILISLVGTVGKVLVLPDNIVPGIINPRLVKLSLDSRVIDGVFAKLYMETDFARHSLLFDSHGGTMEILNLSMIKKLPVPLPSLLEQQEIVRRVEALFALADVIEKRLATATARAEKLTQAILAKAFRGELVPTEAELAHAEGRDYEPASVMLERVRKRTQGGGLP